MCCLSPDGGHLTCSEEGDGQSGGAFRRRWRQAETQKSLSVIGVKPGQGFQVEESACPAAQRCEVIWHAWRRASLGRDDSGSAREARSNCVGARGIGFLVSAQPMDFQPWKGLSRESAFQQDPGTTMWEMNEGKGVGHRGTTGEEAKAGNRRTQVASP